MPVTRNNRLAFTILAAIVLAYFACASSCQQAGQSSRNRSHARIENTSIEKGEQLAAQYCQSCHQLPAPSQLDAATWENGVLPQMGPHLGIFEHLFTKYPNSLGDPNLPANYYPAQALISSADWQHLIDYYTALAPDTLPAQQRKYAIAANTNQFTAVTPGQSYPAPVVCFVRIDSAAKALYLSDIGKQSLFRFNEQLHCTDSVKTGGAIVDMTTDLQHPVACNIGLLSPTNAKAGSLQQVFNNSLGRLKVDTAVLFRQLMRPVNIAAADLNKDGQEDYVVCEFGYQAGALSWLEQKDSHRFERHVLRQVPGAIKTCIQDVNNDGLPDIWALFAQADEAIYLFLNKGNGQFGQQQVLRFPPSNGSVYFELADFNHDGHPDIVYACGDNGDYSTILKPYHGVYIYLNNGHNQFTQHYFFPINGCYKAIARDFDGDGDLDLATIAFFADYAHQPEEGFVYLQNQGNNQDFQPFTVPAARQGRWITLDAGDLDGNGTIDLLLGNCSMGPSFVNTHPNWQQGPPFLVLKNKGR